MKLLLRVPVVGNVFRTLALARFSWSMELMTDSGVNIFNALQWSMEATANGAFEGADAGDHPADQGRRCRSPRAWRCPACSRTTASR